MADDEDMEEALEPGEVEEVEEEDIEALLAAMPEVNLDIFDVVKSSRAQHGLPTRSKRRLAARSASSAAWGRFQRAC